MVIVIALAFIICWSPMYVVAIVSEFHEHNFMKRGNFIFTMLMVHLPGFINSCINPIVYTIMSENYRQSFRGILGRLLMCGCTKETFLQTQSTVSHQLSYVFSSTRKRPPVSEMNVLTSSLRMIEDKDNNINVGSISSESDAMVKNVDNTNSKQEEETLIVKSNIV